MRRVGDGGPEDEQAVKNKVESNVEKPALIGNTSQAGNRAIKAIEQAVYQQGEQSIVIVAQGEQWQTQDTDREAGKRQMIRPYLAVRYSQQQGAVHFSTGSSQGCSPAVNHGLYR